jgi:hypothetical protein
MMAEKILGLLSAFVLGGVSGFFYLAYCFKFVVRHMPETRTKIRALLDRYEPQRVALHPGYGTMPVSFCSEALAIELGLRGVSGHCPLCGVHWPCNEHPDVLFEP